jgi:transglutaminase-like putative cysteine protease
MTFRVTHRTAYHYEEPVSSSFGQMHLLPRSLAGQVSHGTKVDIEPRPSFYQERKDFFGNNVAYFEIASPHTTLAVTTTSTVDVEGRRDDLPLAANQPWEEARLGPAVVSPSVVGPAVVSPAVVGPSVVGPSVGGPSVVGPSVVSPAVVSPAVVEVVEVVEARQFCLDSPLAASSLGLAEYGRASFRAGRPVLDALEDLAQRIYTDFAYTPGATSVTTSAEEVLVKRSGVCQDFAHLAIGCLRSLGMAARYVSGYLETDPPPGRPRMQGADVSHAWASLFVPEAGWVDVDPTNNQLVNDRYITTAWGRDYGDVPPLKGVIFTEGTSHDLEVVVDVIRLPDG